MARRLWLIPGEGQHHHLGALHFSYEASKQHRLASDFYDVVKYRWLSAIIVAEILPEVDWASEVGEVDGGG